MVRTYAFLSQVVTLLAEKAGGWVVVESHPLSRPRIVLDGAEVVVAVRPAPREGTLPASVARASPWVALALEQMCSELNDAEGIGGERDRWGS